MSARAKWWWAALLGSAVVVQAQDENEAPVRWQPPIDVATGAAVRGPWEMNRSRFHYVDDGSVALRDDGVIGVVWANNRRRDIYFQRFDATGRQQLPQPVNVSGSVHTFSWLPRVALGEGGQVYVVWQQIAFTGGSHGGEIYFARSTDGGRTFGEPLNLSRTPAGAGKGRLDEDRWDNGSLDLLLAPGGTLYVAWTEYEGALRLSRSTDGGRSFSEPLHVNADHADGEPAPARAPALALAPDGTLHLAWTLGDHPSADIHLASSSDGGRSFGEPLVVNDTGGYSDAPKLAVDSQGTLHVVHSENPWGPRGLSHVQYTRRLADAEEFDLPIAVAGAPALGDQGASFPSLALDAQDHIYVVWEHHPEAGQPSRGLGLAVSLDGGTSFTEPLVIPRSDDPALGVNGSLQGKLMRKLAVGPTGQLAIVNSYFRERHQSRIRLLRGQLQPPAPPASESD